MNSDAPHNGGRPPPRGHPSAIATARNNGSHGRTLWGRCWVPMPTPTAPGTHRSRNPGSPPQSAGGRGRDSAPHQMPLTTVEGHPPRGRPSSTPAARSPHRACKPRGQCRAPAPAHPRPQHMGSGPRQHAQRAGSRGRGSGRTQTPLTTVNSTPRGDAPPPPPQRATTARKGARCGTVAGSPRPHQPHPGHTGRGTSAARPRGRAARGGTAPNTRRPSQRGKASPPAGTAPYTAPAARKSRQGTQAEGIVRAGPPHPHSGAHSTWVADPDGPPRGQKTGGGGAPELRRPSQRRTAPPRGTPFHHPLRVQQWPARARAAGLKLGPHAHTHRTRDTRVAEPWPPTSQRTGNRGRDSASHQMLLGAEESHPPGTVPHHPISTHPPTEHANQGDSAGHRRPKHAGGGPRQPPRGGGPGEGERLTSDPLAKGPPMPHRRQRGCLMPTRARTRRLAEPAFEIPHPRPTASTTRAPATGDPHPIPCS